MKKLLSLMLALCMMLPLVALANEEYQMPAMNTTDPIRLSVMLWDDIELTRALADSFSKLYPNITVDIILTTAETVQQDLDKWKEESRMPDVFMFQELEPLLINPYLADITRFIENDEEAQTILYPSLRNVGYIDGKHCYFMAGEFVPATIYLDAGTLAKQNIPLPPQTWTWQDFVDLTAAMGNGEQLVWGSSMASPANMAPIALTDDAFGEFGWNGEAFSFTSGWADGLMMQMENQRKGNPLKMGEAQPLDKTYALPLSEGIANLVPYHPPVGTEYGGQLALLDNVAISTDCAYRREAYELMKYLFWGREGWLERVELYPVLCYEDTEERIYEMPNCLPLVQDEELNKALAPLFPPLESWNAWEDFLNAVQNPVTWGVRTIPGFDVFLSKYYNGRKYGGVLGIEAAVNVGAVQAQPYAGQMEAWALLCCDEKLTEFRKVYGLTR